MPKYRVHLQSFQHTKSFKYYLYAALEHVTSLPKERPVTSSQPPCCRPYKPSSCPGSSPAQGVWPSVSGSLNMMSLRCPHTVLSTKAKVSARVLGLQSPKPQPRREEAGQPERWQPPSTVVPKEANSVPQALPGCRLGTPGLGVGIAPAGSVQGTG